MEYGVLIFYFTPPVIELLTFSLPYMTEISVVIRQWT